MPLNLFEVYIRTRRNKREFKLARHGNMTRGKLNATENTNPSLINSDVMLGSKLNKIFPAKYNNDKSNSKVLI